MWQVENKTPFAVLGYFARDRAGLEHWTVAVRARFHILPSQLNTLMEDQGEIRIKPDYADSEGLELQADGDFCPFRPKTDVLLTGEARARAGYEVNKVELGFDLAGRGKRAMVFGKRQLRQKAGKLDLEGYEAFKACALNWRHSLGGPDFLDPGGEANKDNPIGMGWTSKWPNIPDGTEVFLPLIENPEAFVDARPLPAPIGFGAIQPSWQQRASHAGTYDDDWRKYEAPLLPSDFSEQFYQVAPADQIFDLRGGEPGRIFGMHEEGDYGFRLPQVIMDCGTWIRGQKVETRPKLISVLLNGSDKTLEMVWNTSVPCPTGDMSVSHGRVHIKQMAGVER
ncbi:DUF2169 domain-containing protein [Agrobacterium vitis]|uniref:DUF2169 family type VI secretion system accessory protein n=1 Tax=Agrobacterium vitis TaxID=373 RepID=UPI00087242C4|nr:DUF2169 domain-containing protein [Agrobacterium vitis]MCE6074084.1 DUF2169 domain-containing protein [Agrobacterium vitis]MCF1466583.1 DUF2169 domain-containing protein [Agrobacterium vitis]MCM2468914.1 DUF2169 domain-containing protein [Agrobacterium vitis]MUO72286.1 DUF2169 domain-containing protein [Agrobacterium vitis]MUO85044.1 DUF2169 domain-containing protein [Agrobacterium vitis]